MRRLTKSVFLVIKVRGTSLLALLVLLLSIMPRMNALAADYSVGLKVGDWARYENKIRDYYYTQDPSLNRNKTQWVEVEVIGIEGTNVTFTLRTKLPNGSETIETMTTNPAEREVFSSSNMKMANLSNVALFSFLTLANQTVEEQIPVNGMNITSESTAVYAGTNRTIAEATRNSAYNNPYYTFSADSSTFRWDKLTGILAEYTYHFTFGQYAYSGHQIPPQPVVTQWEDQNLKLVETNIWSGASWSPVVSVSSPENRTYSSASVALNFTIDEITSWIGYTLDGKTNVTINGNTTLNGLPDGVHCIKIYANSTSGFSMGASETVMFTVDTKSQFWLTMVGIVIIAGSSGTFLACYAVERIRRKQKGQKPHKTLASIEAPPSLCLYQAVSVFNWYIKLEEKPINGLDFGDISIDLVC